jgi:hypothetical protein
VPGTEANTFPGGLLGGIWAKSGGKVYVANVQGPSALLAVNQRPEVK